MNATRLIPILVLVALAGLAAYLVLDTGSDAEPVAVGVAAGVEPGATTPAVDGADVVVYKSPTCGCCRGWVEHMREAGFDVEAVDVEEYGDLAARKAEAGVPDDLGACHTARVGGYFVEGHVPAEVVARLLEEHPADIAGIAVPGMPQGSPGMESPDPRPYDVIAVGRDGSRSVYESVYPDQPASVIR